MTANSCFHSISLFASFNMSPYVWSSTLYGRDAHLNTFAVNENCYCTGFFIYICSIISCNSSVCHAILSMPWLIYITFMEQLCLFWSSGCWMDTRLCCDTDSTAARYMTLRPLHHHCVGYVYYYYMLSGLCGLLVYAIWWSGPPSILCPLDGYFSLLISQFMLLHFALPDLHVRQRLKVLIRFRISGFRSFILIWEERFPIVHVIYNFLKLGLQAQKIILVQNTCW